MSKGNTILLTNDPKGIFFEGTIGDTSKPGTLMQVKEATNPISGRMTLIALGSNVALGADGSPALIMVLLEDDEQGKLVTDAYVANTRCRAYCPAAGEELNVLAGEAAGTTGNNFAIGDRLMADTDSGNLIPASGSPASVPFVSMEKASAVTEPYLLNVLYTGH